MSISTIILFRFFIFRLKLNEFCFAYLFTIIINYMHTNTRIQSYTRTHTFRRSQQHSLTSSLSLNFSHSPLSVYFCYASKYFSKSINGVSVTQWILSGRAEWIRKKKHCWIQIWNKKQWRNEQNNDEEKHADEHRQNRPGPLKLIKRTTGRKKAGAVWLFPIAISSEAMLR